MSERFEKLFTLPDNLYSEQAPIIITAGSLLKDTETGKIIAQLKFHSIYNKKIKALRISVSAYDVSGNELEGVDDYQYLDLEIHNGQEFGSNKAIVLPNEFTRSFAIKNIFVVLADGISIGVNLPLSPLPKSQTLQQKLNDLELVKQYQIETKTNGIMVPICKDNIWYCPCGEWNNSKTCTKCHSDKETIFHEYNVSLLLEKKNVRLEKEKEEQEKQLKLTEAARLEALEKERANKVAIKKKVTKFSIFLVISIIVIVSLLFAVNIVKNIITYNDALQLKNDGKYDEACVLFEKLDEYKDSYVQYIECKKEIGLYSEYINYYNLSEFKIPEGSTTIKRDAFSGCRNLNVIYIPKTIVNIEPYAFHNCDNLIDVTIPNCVTSIDVGAFDHCDNLEKVFIPNSVLSVGGYVFNHCPKLTIYVEHTSKPSAWDELWNNSNCKVVWGDKTK